MVTIAPINTEGNCGFVVVPDSRANALDNFNIQQRFNILLSASPKDFPDIKND